MRRNKMKERERENNVKRERTKRCKLKKKDE